MYRFAFIIFDTDKRITVFADTLAEAYKEVDDIGLPGIVGSRDCEWVSIDRLPDDDAMFLDMGLDKEE